MDSNEKPTFLSVTTMSEWKQAEKLLEESAIIARRIIKRASVEERPELKKRFHAILYNTTSLKKD